MFLEANPIPEYKPAQRSIVCSLLRSLVVFAVSSTVWFTVWSTMTAGFLFMPGAYAAAEGTEEPLRVKYNFNSAWRLKVGEVGGAEAALFDDSAWQEISLPHAFNEDDAFRKSIHDLTTGIAWYRKHFVLKGSDQGKKFFLEFEGIRQAGEFYLNGKLIGRHENGVMAFGFDVTKDLNPAPAENVLAVRIDNSWTYREKATGVTFQWNNTNFYANYGGIGKNVYLYTTGRLYQTLPLFSNLGTTGVYVYAREFDLPAKAATVAVESQVKNDSERPQTFSYRVRIEDMQGSVVGTMDGGSYTIPPGESKTLKASARIRGLHLWSWGYGYLYSVYSTLNVGGHPVDTVKTRTGFRQTEFSHGMVKLNGRVIQMKGYAQRTTNEWPAIGLSVPPWMSDYSNRLMVEGNANLVRWMHVTPWKQDVESCDRVGLIEAMPAGDAEKDSSGRQWEQRVELMRDAIVYNRNNPSIFFYESGNKGISEEHMKAMKAVRDEFDPYGGRAIGAREMLDSKIAEYGGEMLYINRSSAKPLWAMEFSRDEGSREFWDDFTPPYHKDSPDYNRNQDSHAIEDVVRWYDYWHERPGTGDRISAGGVNIIFSDSNTHFRGDNNYRRSGEVDAMRLPKDGYYANQVMWDGWVDVERPRIHILGHWNYSRETTKNVYVVSSAKSVELFLNGTSLGRGEKSSEFLFTFKNVAWHEGILTAKGYDSDGKSICEAEKKTAGAPAAIRLTIHTGPTGLQADGADLAFVDVEVVDSDGRRVPTALNLVKFSVSGPVEWRGGIAQGPENYIMSQALPVENGVNRVILRSRMTAGTIQVRATAEGLKPATITLKSLPFANDHGLSLELPGEGLPPNVARGETPPGASFHPWRFPIAIAAATAGSNAGEASKSYDDDETTSWTSNGDLSNAWIEYRFAEPTTVGEVTMKLLGWRLRKYPLRITLDGQEVFAGETPTSLGYVTLPLKHLTGTRLRIALAGATHDHDAFGNVVEVTGKKDAADTGADVIKAGATIRIVEAEVYRATGN